MSSQNKCTILKFNFTESENMESVSFFFYVVNSNHLFSVAFWLGVAFVSAHFLALCAVIAGKSKSPPSTISMVNLILSSSILIILHIAKVFKDTEFFTIESSLICRSWGFLLRLLYSLNSFASVVTFYEIVNAVRISLKPSLKWRVFLSAWMASIVISFPAIWNYRLDKEGTDYGNDPCQKVLLFDSKALYLIWDNLYMGMIHIIPVWQTVYALRRFKLRMLYICHPIPENLRKHIMKIRWTFFHLAWMATFWVFPGFGYQVIRFFYRNEGLRESACAQHIQFYMLLRCNLIFQRGLSPFIYMYAHNKLRFLEQVGRSFSFVLLGGYGTCRRRTGDSEAETTMIAQD